MGLTQLLRLIGHLSLSVGWKYLKVMRCKSKDIDIRTCILNANQVTCLICFPTILGS